MKIKNLTEGLNAQQRSVPQLPAQAQARRISVLGTKKDPRHPFAGYAVGAGESAEPGAKRLGPDRNDPWEQGWRANPAHAENPYEQGTKEHAQWEDGQAERRAQPRHYDEGVAEGTDIGDSKVPTGTMVEGQFKDYGSVSANTMQPAVTKTKSDAGKSTAYNSGFKVGRAGGPSKVPDGLHPDHHASWKRGHESGDYYLRTMAAHDEKMAGGNKIQKQGVAEGRAGVDDTDTVGFSVNSEAAYTAVMKRFGDVIDHDETSGIMYAPARVWPQIEMVAFDADGEGAVRDDGIDESGVAEGERNEMDTPAVQAALRKMAERHKGEKWSKEQLAALGKRIAARGKKAVKEEEIEEGWKSKLAGAALAGAAALGSGGANAADVNDPSWSKAGYDSHVKADSSLTKTTSSDGVSAPKVSKDLQRRISDVTGPNAQGQYRVTVTQNGKIASQYVTKTPPPGWLVKESADNITKEDIISKLKARLGDYLSDISKEIKKDPDLIDKLAAKAPGDQMGPPVKTVTTDDGHQIQIHGNEDDGFRISIKNKQAPSKFSNLDEAVMACEMYCARRREQALNADYVEEA